jgi:DNA-binding NtrC family response regulator
MIVGDSHIEHQILLVTSQEGALEPMVAVMRTIFQQMPATMPPDKTIAIMEMRNIDLVIVDMQDCKEPLALIRSCKERFAHVPVIAMVPYGNVNTVEQVLSHGADDYISQPIALERLKTTLRNALRMRQLLLGNGAVEVHDHDDMYSRSMQHMSILMDKNGRMHTLRKIEDAVIEYTIKHCDGCITQAARVLGVGRSTLYRKLQEKMTDRVQSSRENQLTRPMMAESSMSDS